MHAAGLNSMGYGMNCGSENQPALSTSEPSTMPNGMAIRQPMMMPKKIEPSFSTPLPKFASANTTANVIRPTIQFVRPPKLAVPAPPAMYLMAVGYSDTPMVKMTVPVTSGGNSGFTFE